MIFLRFEDGTVESVFREVECGCDEKYASAIVLWLMLFVCNVRDLEC